MSREERKRERRLNVRLSQENYDELSRLARRQGISRSDLVRKAIGYEKQTLETLDQGRELTSDNNSVAKVIDFQGSTSQYSRQRNEIGFALPKPGKTPAPYQAFISSLQDDTEALRDTARTRCLQNQIDPCSSSLGKLDALENSDLFVGIYDQRFGEPYGDSQQLSRVHLELNMAKKHLGSENLILFTRSPGTYFEQMLGGHKVTEFETELEFQLLLDEALKDWLDRRTKSRDQRPREHIVILGVRGPDYQGILNRVALTVFINGGSLLRGHQKSLLGMSTCDFEIEWPNPMTDEERDELKLLIRQQLNELSVGLGDETKVRILKEPRKENTVTKKGVFVVRFFDSPGIGERIFRRFSDREISVVGCNLEVLAETPVRLTELRIEANMTSLEKEVTKTIGEDLARVAGVINAESATRFGLWIH